MTARRFRFALPGSEWALVEADDRGEYTRWTGTDLAVSVLPGAWELATLWVNNVLIHERLAYVPEHASATAVRTAELTGARLDVQGDPPSVVPGRNY